MKRFLASLGLLALVLYWFLYAAFTPDIRVTVINVSDKVLEDVQVHGSGASYGLGDIPAGGRAKKGFDITQDSNIVLSHKGQRYIIDGYITRGYMGRITIELDENNFVETFNSID